jgi:hypothetical protein
MIMRGAPVTGERDSRRSSFEYVKTGLHLRGSRVDRLLLAAVLTATFNGVPLAAEPSASKAQAPSPQISIEELYRNLHCMEQRIQYLEAQGRGKTSASKDTGDQAGSAGNKEDQIPSKPAVSTGAPDQQALSSGELPPACASLASAPSKSKTNANDASNKDLFALSPTQPPAGNKDMFALPPPNSAVPATGDKAIFGLASSPVEGLKLGSYGEIKYGSRQNPDANGQWQNGFDPSRLVLLPTYAITDRIIFNAEIEFEHGGTGFDADDKLHGTAEIEQIWIDFKITDWFNFRSPGVDLVPLGYTNLHHEPTLFYSVDRPELANALIPTTWKVPSSSIYGQIVEGLSYQFQVSMSLEDFGDVFEARTDANTVPAFPIGYAAGITGIDALGLATPPRGDFRQLNNDLAYAAQLTYSPTFLPVVPAFISRRIQRHEGRMPTTERC